MFLPGSIHVPVISRLFSLTKARTCLGNLVVQYIIHCKKPVVREKRKDMIMCTVVKTPKWFDIFGVTDVFLLLLQLSLLVSEAVSHTRVLTEALKLACLFKTSPGQQGYFVLTCIEFLRAKVTLNRQIL